MFLNMKNKILFFFAVIGIISSSFFILQGFKKFATYVVIGMESSGTPFLFTNQYNESYLNEWNLE